MELFQLEAFLAVVREGSFSAAAKALFRTQPAISQTIKKLEDEIGRPLFDRSSRRGVLTDAGRVLADHAERLVNLRQRAMAALDDVRQLRTGRLTMAANELTCLYLLPILHEYRRLYPEVHITVQRALGSRVPAQVLDYGADFGVDHLSAGHHGAQLDRRLSRRARVRGAADRIRSRGARRCRSASWPASRSSRITCRRRIAQRVIETFRKKRVELRMPVEMPTIDAIKKFVAMGNGVALLPAITVEREVAHKELVRVQVPELAFDRKLRLIHRREGTLSHAAEALLAVVEAQSELRRGRFAFAAER